MRFYYFMRSVSDVWIKKHTSVYTQAGKKIFNKLRLHIDNRKKIKAVGVRRDPSSKTLHIIKYKRESRALNAFPCFYSYTFHQYIC